MTFRAGEIKTAALETVRPFTGRAAQFALTDDELVAPRLDRGAPMARPPGDQRLAREHRVMGELPDVRLEEATERRHGVGGGRDIEAGRRDRGDLRRLIERPATEGRGDPPVSRDRRGPV